MSWKLYPSITSIGLRLFDLVLIIIGLSGVEYDADSIDEIGDADSIDEIGDADSIDEVDDADSIDEVDDADAFLIEDYFPF